VSPLLKVLSGLLLSLTSAVGGTHTNEITSAINKLTAATTSTVSNLTTVGGLPAVGGVAVGTGVPLLDGLLETVGKLWNSIVSGVTSGKLASRGDKDPGLGLGLVFHL
jgi:hypothetical protein